jgi:hypothetical protein
MYTLKLRPMRITYYIRKNPRWSDGVGVTGRDFAFTGARLNYSDYCNRTVTRLLSRADQELNQKKRLA